MPPKDPSSTLDSGSKNCFSQPIQSRLDVLPVRNARLEKTIEARAVVMHFQVTKLMRNYIVDAFARRTNKIWIQR